MKKDLFTLLKAFLLAAMLFPVAGHARLSIHDTLSLQFDLNPQKWDYPLHFQVSNNEFPSALLPLNVPSGLYVSGIHLIDYEIRVLEDAKLNPTLSDDFEIQVQSFDNRREAVANLFVRPYRLKQGKVEQMTLGRLVVHYDSVSARAANTPTAYTTASVLRQGPWLKIAVVGSGAYRITPADLAAAGWNVGQIDPRRLALFGNGGMMLPERNNAFRYDDLVENPIVVVGEADGIFNQSDALYFYGQSTTAWFYNPMTIRYDHRIHDYSDTTFYFLTVLDRPGLRMADKPQATQNPTVNVDIFLDYALHENDLENLIHSGRIWYGESFTRQNDRLNIRFQFPNRVIQRPVMLNAQMAVRSLTETTAFSLDLNGQSAMPQQTFLPIVTGAAAYAREQSYNLSLTLDQSDSLNFLLRYHAAQDNSRGWLNFLRVNVWRQLKYVPGRQLAFRNPEAVGYNVVARFGVAQANPDLWLWDVTNAIRPAKQQFDAGGGMISFNVLGDTVREYVLFHPSDIPPPVSIRSIANQNLHGIQMADMLIITARPFRQHAEAMAALHLQHDGLESVVVCIDQVFNEFGSGKPDVSALRDFIRMVYTRSGDRLRYVLLFGDASYDYKNRIPQNTNFIPTYQSTQSMIETQSFVSDDYFGLMGNTEGQDMQGVLDLGIGRFPVKTPDEAMAMVAKNYRYLSGLETQRGPWQNNITFMADDMDGNLHFSQAETLAMHVDTAYRSFNIKKIYLDAFRRVAVPGGFRYPDATAAVLKAIHDGSLIVNYTGHGGVNGLTDEKVLSIGEIENLTNANRLAFFVTATCEFSRFDNPSLVSAGERLLLNPNGGAIALMTTTRLAFAHSNFNVNRRLYASLMTTGKTDINRLGDIIRLSKNPTNSYIYNFVLLGNPALRLNYPENRVELITLNGQTVDTLHAMSEVVIQGKITLPSGQLAVDFNGIVHVLMFDKKTTYRTLGNDVMSPPANFSFYDRLLFKGKATVKNGMFQIGFKLPRSIAYNYGKSRISFFASDSTNNITAGGYFDNVVLGGYDPNITPDGTGPDIILLADDASFMDGDLLPPNPTIWAHIADPQGVHFLGTEIGRDIVATHILPDGSVRKYVLNNLFEPETDNPTAGSLQITLNGLAQGNHRLSLRAWDLHNNSAEKEIRFVVNPGQQLSISNVQLRPNPFTDEIVIRFEHNKPGQKMLIVLEVYDVFGNLLYQRQHQMRPSGHISDPLRLQASDFAGGHLPTGAYLWRLIAEPEEGLKQTVSGRMIRKSR